MSAVETQGESRSSIKLVRNASGKTQIECKVYATGEDPLAMETMEREAVAIYERLCLQYPQDGAK